MIRYAAVGALSLAAIAPAPKPKTGAPPWKAPANPIVRTKQAGLKPELFEHLEYHVHSHLDIFVNGKKIKIPAGIGINTNDPGVHQGVLPDGSIGYGGIQQCAHPCISPLHTHADLGLLHTETSTPKPNTLGQFFVEWNVRLSPRCVGGYCKPDSILFYVKGKRYKGDPRQILLADKTEIAIVIGTPPETIPKKFPAVPI
ncbi:MAG TPA: hypothetical protein VGF23_15695 [Gaiellaceae bacterium]